MNMKNNRKYVRGGVYFFSNTLKKNKKLLTVTVILIVTVFIVISGKSYAYLEKSVEGGSVSLEVDDLNQSINGKVTLQAGTTKKLELVVKNNDNIPSKYQIFYTSSDDLSSVSVGYSSESADLPYGDIDTKGSKAVLLTFKNDSVNSVEIEVGVKGGLSTNSIEDIILNDSEYRINQPLEVVEKLTNVTSFTEIQSTSFNASNNTYTFDISALTGNYKDLVLWETLIPCFVNYAIKAAKVWGHIPVGVKYDELDRGYSYDATTGILTLKCHIDGNYIQSSGEKYATIDALILE